MRKGMKRRPGAPMSLPLGLLDEHASQEVQGANAFAGLSPEAQARELAVVLVRQHLRQSSQDPMTDPLLAEYDRRYPPSDSSSNKKSFVVDALKLDYDPVAGTLLECLVRKCLTQPPTGAPVPEESNVYVNDREVTIGGLHINEDSCLPLSMIAHLHDLDLAHAKKLGKGAGGVVSKVKHLPDGKYFAVKQVAMGSQDAAEQVKAELRVMWGTSRSHNVVMSPFVVRCAGIFYDDLTMYIVMDLMDGSLKDGADAAPMDEATCRAVAFQIVRGLDYMHNVRKQLHRDIKPHNILFSSDGIVKLTDFGIASKKMETYFLKRGTFCGTLHYLSPARAAGREYSFEGDLWGLGLSLWQLAAGKLPFGGATVFEIAELESHPPRFTSELAPGGQKPFTAEMCSFVNRCMETDPAKYPVVKELIQHPWLRSLDIDESRRLIALWAKKALQAPGKATESYDPFTGLDDALK